MKERWWTAPAAGDGGRRRDCDGRDYMDDIIAKGKFNIRVDVRWDYTPSPRECRRTPTPHLMEQATDALMQTFRKDKAPT